jgi:hypothetical protein
VAPSPAAQRLIEAGLRFENGGERPPPKPRHVITGPAEAPPAAIEQTHATLCSACGSPSSVINSRVQRKLGAVTRRRQCDFCHTRWTTKETVVDADDADVLRDALRPIRDALSALIDQTAAPPLKVDRRRKDGERSPTPTGADT